MINASEIIDFQAERTLYPSTEYPHHLVDQLDGMIVDIDKWLRELPISQKTVDLYGHYLIMFAQWMVDNQIDPEKAEPFHAIRFFDEHKEWGYSVRYNTVSAIRQFYRHKFGENHPACKLRIRKVQPPPQRSLTAEELKQLLDTIETDSPIGKRDRAIIWLMTDTGMRASEIVNLEIKHVDLDKLSLWTLTKGGKWMLKVHTEDTAEALRDWLSVRDRVTKDRKFMFVSVGGHTPGKKMGNSGLEQLMERLASRAQIDIFTPHALRRTFATLAIENGAPTRVVQLAGGWSTLAMVERYSRNLTPDSIKGYSPIRLYNQNKNGDGKGNGRSNE